MNKKIEAYVEGIFADLENRQEYRELKEEIVANLDERMSDYMEKGMSENKAYTKVISDLGDIDELIMEKDNMDVNNQPERKLSRNTDEEVEIKEREGEASRSKRAKTTAIGVGKIVFSGVFPIIYADIFQRTYRNIFIALMVVCVAIGVGLLIYGNGFRDKRHRQSSADKTYKAIHDVVWSIATLIYFVMGIKLGGWSYGWIVFIVAFLVNSILRSVFAKDC